MTEQIKKGIIKRVAGPLVVVNGIPDAKMSEVVNVGDERLVGEVIRIDNNDVYVQVYEETSGIGPGEPVYLTGEPLTVELGPGLIGNIYDGIQRPLPVLQQKSGDFISRGITANALDKNKKWDIKMLKNKGDEIMAGDIIAETQETELLNHKIMAMGFSGKGIIEYTANSGEYTIDDVIAKIKTQNNKIIDIKLSHKWPIREPRLLKNKLLPNKALITGQRIIDSLFPIAKGGAGCVPGPFGSGKTVVQHQFAKWSDADIIIFVGCGERGNEMTDLLNEFPELKDPKTGRPLMERTVLIANTSNMPVAAREASVYTGVTIGEYFRDMGYSVALLADSTSRWAEALREISGRLEEMPGDEGYPAYLGSRTAAFYERAGYVKCLGSEDREGFLTIVGAVSPPGGDLSEPVTQNTLRVTKVFWALDSSLAYKRHFPAINWLSSYTLYNKNLKDFFEKNGGENFSVFQKHIMHILQKESELQEIVRLVGLDALSQQDQFLLETARIIREDFLHQNAFIETDTYTSLKKQYLMIKTIINMHKKGNKAIENGKKVENILSEEIKSKISKMKMIPEDNLEQFNILEKEIEKEIEKETQETTQEETQETNNKK